jgi:NADPH-dependent 2,4-dienoyl-CoA reductase/sulfur reductase-like enzyme
VDENAHSGGQYLRRVSPSLGVDSRPVRERLKRFGHELTKNLDQPGVSIKQGTEIAGWESDGSIWTLGEDGCIDQHSADFFILATGARERFLPFPGWTMPGVISTGAGQILVKSAGMLPGSHPIIGGSGPLPLALAGEISASGGRVQAYWNQSSWSQQLSTLKGCLHHVSKVNLGIHFLVRLVASRTMMFHGCKVLEARGDKILEEVVLTAMNREGSAIRGTERTFSTDCLAVGYGFVPNLELAMSVGCDLEHDSTKGGWVVKVDENLQSSVPNVFAAGELTGIAGAEKSIIEGRLAGMAAADLIGVLNDGNDQKERIRLQKRRNRELAFGAFINGLATPPPGMLKDLPDQTMICRCEDVRLGQIREQIRNGYTTLDALKKATNSGMGNCQGRTCGPIIQDVLAAFTHLMPQNVQPYTVRNPIKPVPLSALAESDNKDPS